MDDNQIVNEIKIRRRVQAIFNKRQDDFASKDEWDNYLENMEDIIYNLANNIDKPHTEARIAEYERANRANIIANQARQAQEEQQRAAAAVQAATGVEVAVPSAAGAPQAAPAFTQQGAGQPVLLAAQPVPIKPAAMDASGTLVHQFALTSRQQLESMAAASGWHQGLPKQRALHEAFTSLMVF